jgi:hypothetical protein
MIVLYILTGIFTAALLWIIADILIALSYRPLPDLPEEFLSPMGLSEVYHYLTEPDIPDQSVPSPSTAIAPPGSRARFSSRSAITSATVAVLTGGAYT